jgi:hypothetical protein
VARFLTCHLIAVTLLLAGAPAARAVASWQAPVDGAVTRGFAVAADQFAPGQHRGADFAAAPGAVVRAACSGRVVVAGRVGTSGRVVTIRCGVWRATHMPLATVAVHAGATIHRGTIIGTLARSSQHAGVHLGARRDGVTYGYTDPLRFITSTHRRLTPPAVIPRRGTRTPARATAPPPSPAPARPPLGARLRGSASPRAGRSASPPARRSASPPARGSAPVAPWPVWAGLSALLAGAFGTGVRVRVRRRHVAAAGAIASEAS